jgi:hypothetical protein
MLETKHVSKPVISANLTAIICLAMVVIKMKTDIFITGRTDDVINVRDISTAEMEEVVAPTVRG